MATASRGSAGVPQATDNPIITLHQLLAEAGAADLLVIRGNDRSPAAIERAGAVCAQVLEQINARAFQNSMAASPHFSVLSESSQYIANYVRGLQAQIPALSAAAPRLEARTVAPIRPTSAILTASGAAISTSPLLSSTAFRSIESVDSFGNDSPTQGGSRSPSRILSPSELVLSATPTASAAAISTSPLLSSTTCAFTEGADLIGNNAPHRTADTIPDTAPIDLAWSGEFTELIEIAGRDHSDAGASNNHPLNHHYGASSHSSTRSLSDDPSPTDRLMQAACADSPLLSVETLPQHHSPPPATATAAAASAATPRPTRSVDAKSSHNGTRSSANPNRHAPARTTAKASHRSGGSTNSSAPAVAATRVRSASTQTQRSNSWTRRRQNA